MDKMSEIVFGSGLRRHASAVVTPGINRAGSPGATGRDARTA